ncbi:ribonuclease domain-containing protein [Rheinheimera hassiensis]|uniref:ribonuclease domain-containing protein n=1 Tax=Rheinheimera hassiensis TaxID=1193627 RepID=UPI001F0567E4|nr:ribonuclease domain-containing protein [Rheinheimera hassiensis]
MKKFLLILLVLAGIYHFQGSNLSDSFNGGSQQAVTQQSDSPPQHLFAQERELEKTLLRIRDNGPFPYDRDGITFHNRERLLPIKPSGYYREYTVDTPGLSHRGPRRVVTGGNPPDVYYYTEDHYSSFRIISGAP